jgi:hypothetical protein
MNANFFEMDYTNLSKHRRTVEVKVSLGLWVIMHRAIKVYWGMEVELHGFLVSALKVKVKCKVVPVLL